MPSKPKIVWLDALSCNGCSHSFFNHPEIEAFFECEILHHPLLDYSTQKKECDILIIEGALKESLKRAEMDFFKLFESYINHAKVIIALGSCASYGGMFGEGILFNKEKSGRYYRLKDKTINIPGCPAHPEWLMYVIGMLREKKEICLDELNRPVEIFSYTSHMGCVRNEYFEWKVDCESFGEKEGCLFYYQGCQGPYTHSSCNKTLWNEVNSKPRAGTPCFGCTEPAFPKTDLFNSETLMGLPANIPLGVSKRAYFTLAGVAKSLKNERLNKKLIKCENED
ncbi:MAG: hydrogenase [Epsilonproteobacteria bacterium]|nr:hydrogenase [Campylobacterota bacterium]